MIHETGFMLTTILTVTIEKNAKTLENTSTYNCLS